MSTELIDEEFEWVKKYAEIKNNTVWHKGYINTRGYKVLPKPFKNKVNHGKGYCATRLNRRLFLVHRVVFMLSNNRPIKKGFDIDHINGIKHDNRIENLREVTRRDNSINKSRHRQGRLAGVSFHQKTNKWTTQIQINNKDIYLGYYDTELDAHLAYCKARQELKQ